MLKYSEKRPVTNLNSIPSPSYDLIPFEIRHECLIGIETSRGCPFSCVYCSERRYWGKPRYKSQEKISNDLKEYLKYFPKTNIYIYDSSFNVCKNHLKRVLPVLKESGATFACNVVALIDNNTLNNMSKSGITQICLGIETSSDEIIKIMRRPVSFKDCFNFTRIASDIIPFVRGNWIIGLPGQTKESLSLELSNLEKILYNDNLLDVSPRPYVPYPGTLPFEFPDKYGIKILSKHWPDYTRFSYPVYELARLSADEIYQGFIDALKLTCYIPREIRLKASNN